jgi:pyruvate, orthophosphate dikinase
MSRDARFYGLGPVRRRPGSSDVPFTEEPILTLSVAAAAGIRVPAGLLLTRRGLQALVGDGVGPHGRRQCLAVIRELRRRTLRMGGRVSFRLEVAPAAPSGRPSDRLPPVIVAGGSPAALASALCGALAAAATGGAEGAQVVAVPGEPCAWFLCTTRDSRTGARGLRWRYAVADRPDALRERSSALPPLRHRPRPAPAIDAAFRRRLEGLAGTWLDSHELELFDDDGVPCLVRARTLTLGAAAALKRAVSGARQGTWSRSHAVGMVGVAQVDVLLRPAPRRRHLAALPVVAAGEPISPGVASGRLAFSAERARGWARSGARVVLVATAVSPRDVAAVGARGAVVAGPLGPESGPAEAARASGVPLVAAVPSATFWAAAAAVEGSPVEEGSWVTVDGNRGLVLLGEARLSPRPLHPDLRALLSWADETASSRGLGFRCNADSAREARAGTTLGARGVGLCRTERLLGDAQGLSLLGACLTAESEGERRRAVRRLESLLSGRYRPLIAATRGERITVRLLDPTLGELASSPRGSSVGLLHPELYELQVRALVDAACAVRARSRIPGLEVLLPLVRVEGEAAALGSLIRRVASAAAARHGIVLPCRVGAMIETPRAALTAGPLSRHIDFLCFGTNDLTSTTWGLARESAGRILALYRERGILSDDPFRVLDDDGVGALIRTAASRARAANPDIVIGVCGEHAGDPRSVGLLLAAPEEARIDYLSCSPGRLPGARIAAAQALAATERDDQRGGFLTPPRTRW